MTQPECFLRLFVVSGTPRAEQAVSSVRRMLTQRFGDGFRLQIIDVAEYPDLAEEAGILATPALVWEAPPPVRRLVGDMTDETAVMRNLMVVPASLDTEASAGGRRDGKR